jgi:hypothetical protein
VDRAAVSVRRLTVGRLTPYGTVRMTVPYGELDKVATAIARLRKTGFEVTVAANPGTLHRSDGTSDDHGLRIIAKRKRDH